MRYCSTFCKPTSYKIRVYFSTYNDDRAKYFNLSTILTTSFEDGPNGPLVSEIKAMFPDAPYISRPGQINVWDNDDFVQAVKVTGKKQLLIAGIYTWWFAQVLAYIGAYSELAEQKTSTPENQFLHYVHSTAPGLG